MLQVVLNYGVGKRLHHCYEERRNLLEMMRGVINGVRQQTGTCQLSFPSFSLCAQRDFKYHRKSSLGWFPPTVELQDLIPGLGFLPSALQAPDAISSPSREPIRCKWGALPQLSLLMRHGTNCTSSFSFSFGVRARILVQKSGNVMQINAILPAGRELRNPVCHHSNICLETQATQTEHSA